MNGKCLPHEAHACLECTPWPWCDERTLIEDHTHNFIFSIQVLWRWNGGLINSSYSRLAWLTEARVYRNERGCGCQKGAQIVFVLSNLWRDQANQRQMDTKGNGKKWIILHHLQSHTDKNPAAHTHWSSNLDHHHFQNWATCSEVAGRRRRRKSLNQTKSKLIANKQTEQKKTSIRNGKLLEVCPFFLTGHLFLGEKGLPFTSQNNSTRKRKRCRVGHACINQNDRFPKCPQANLTYTRKHLHLIITMINKQTIFFIESTNQRAMRRRRRRRGEEDYIWNCLLVFG